MSYYSDCYKPPYIPDRPERHRPEPCPPPKKETCGPLPGTLLRIFIPAGATISLLNLLEVTSPSGICLIVRIPLLAGCGSHDSVASVIDAVKNIGGSVEFM